MEENNGMRALPGLTNGPHVSSAKPDISLLSMLPKEQTSGTNPPLPRRESEATTYAGDDSAPHHRRGVGGFGRVNLSQAPRAQYLKGEPVFRRETGERECVFYRCSLRKGMR